MGPLTPVILIIPAPPVLPLLLEMTTLDGSATSNILGAASVPPALVPGLVVKASACNSMRLAIRFPCVGQ